VGAQPARPLPRPVDPKSERDILDYVDPPAVYLPPNAPPSMQNLARKARTNYLPRVLNEFVQALKVDGYRAEGGTDNAAPWKYAWQANKLDGRQGGIHRDALAYGICYATVMPGTDPITERADAGDPRRVTAEDDRALRRPGRRRLADVRAQARRPAAPPVRRRAGLLHRPRRQPRRPDVGRR
jgi:hypothetical protein